jgi:glycine/D-amino acid oxidase-like deaminating enzyme
MIPARVRHELGRPGSVVRDLATPSHVVRWLGDDRLLIAGADGERVPDRLSARAVLQRTNQLMYELSTLYPEISGIQPEYGWSADYARTVDGLPYIGAHRNFPHHLFAFGDSSHGVTGAYLASRILVRQCSGEMDRADEAFGFHR